MTGRETDVMSRLVSALAYACHYTGEGDVKWALCAGLLAVEHGLTPADAARLVWAVRRHDDPADARLQAVENRVDELVAAASSPDRETTAAAYSELSPLTQAEQAKRERDLPGELGALKSGYEALTSAPWYPAQAGDIVHICYWGSLVDAMPPQGETYVVEHSQEEGGLVLRLLHADERLVGPGSAVPGMVDDPLMELWMEGGPDCLTIVRNGRVVHGGPR
jgi:hypothetical protein